MNIIKDIIDYLSKLFTWWVVVMPWEQGIRVTLGKKMLLMTKGVYLKLPLLHTIFVQEKRLRVINLPIQTICTSDGHALTLSCSVGYSIVDIIKLYNTLYQPDMTISNIVAAKIAEQICNVKLEDCKPSMVQAGVNESLLSSDYGLKFEYVNITNFAYVKTFRLIQDQSYMYEGLNLLKTK